MTKINGTLRRVALAAFMLFAVWIFTQFTGCAPPKTLGSNCETYYRIEPGPLCRWRSSSSSGYEFFSCDNGRRYLNPKWYHEERVCK